VTEDRGVVNMVQNINKFNLERINLTKYLFFTGKGGVGKTSTSCATAVSLADQGKKVLLVSTDPASNLQDVFETPLSDKETYIKDCPNLAVINVDPIKAAAIYRESVVGPYRGLLPDSALSQMEEQLSGSCTVEIAAFNEFARLLTDEKIKSEFDYIIFDTAPTGHTLRLLELPSAWTNFIDENTSGASCLGQLSGLGDQREMYKVAVDTLSDNKKMTLVLVTRPQYTSIMEADRSSLELADFGIKNQILVINGLLEEATDEISEKMIKTQDEAIAQMPDNLSQLTTYYIPLKSYNVTGINRVRNFLSFDDKAHSIDKIHLEKEDYKSLDVLIDDLYNNGKKVIFTMGKGGVGKTTIASEIANGLVSRGLNVHLTTTDPANHLNYVVENDMENLTISHIDEKLELKKYQDEVLDKARETMSPEDLAYIEEDLRSPCTQEIAVFRAFAEIVDKSENEVVVIDTAPTGHTLLLLDSTQSYSQEISRSNGEIPESVYKLLPRLRNEKETEVVIVTLPETTPVFEAERLQEDLERAGIMNKWWVVNQSLLNSNVQNPLLIARAVSEKEWIDRVNQVSNGNFVVIPWHN
jgi:arsenite/tail-anchored protein-transporting ATPase